MQLYFNSLSGMFKAAVIGIAEILRADSGSKQTDEYEFKKSPCWGCGPRFPSCLNLWNKVFCLCLNWLLNM